MILLVDASKHHHLDHRAHGAGGKDRHQQAGPEAGRYADLVGDDHRHEGGDHVERAVRHVDDAQRAEDE